MIMIHPTIETLRRLRLTGMAKALEEQQGLPDCDRLSFDERLAAIAAIWASVWVRAFFAYGISRSIPQRSTLSAGHGL
jgi:hypothetical protein